MGPGVRPRSFLPVILQAVGISISLEGTALYHIPLLWDEIMSHSRSSPCAMPPASRLSGPKISLVNKWRSGEHYHHHHKSILQRSLTELDSQSPRITLRNLLDVLFILAHRPCPVVLWGEMKLAVRVDFQMKWWGVYWCQHGHQPRSHQGLGSVGHGHWWYRLPGCKEQIK